MQQPLGTTEPTSEPAKTGKLPPFEESMVTTSEITQIDREVAALFKPFDAIPELQIPMQSTSKLLTDSRLAEKDKEKIRKLVNTFKVDLAKLQNTTVTTISDSLISRFKTDNNQTSQFLELSARYRDNPEQLIWDHTSNVSEARLVNEALGIGMPPRSIFQSYILGHPELFTDTKEQLVKAHSADFFITSIADYILTYRALSDGLIVNLVRMYNRINSTQS